MARKFMIFALLSVLVGCDGPSIDIPVVQPQTVTRMLVIEEVRINNAAWMYLIRDSETEKEYIFIDGRHEDIFLTVTDSGRIPLED